MRRFNSGGSLIRAGEKLPEKKKAGVNPRLSLCPAAGEGAGRVQMISKWICSKIRVAPVLGAPGIRYSKHVASPGLQTFPLCSWRVIALPQ